MNETLAANSAQWFGPPCGRSRKAAADDPAVICVNDDLALRVRAACGPDVDVYGIDGLPEALAAGIPTIVQPMRDMARKAIELLAAQQKQNVHWQAQAVYCRGELVRPGLAG